MAGHSKWAQIKRQKEKTDAAKSKLFGKLAKLITDEEAELVAISKKSQVIRVDVKEIPTLGRQTQGVRIMKMREGDSIASLSLI
jgi:DNA gyrase subunit A